MNKGAPFSQTIELHRTLGFRKTQRRQVLDRKQIEWMNYSQFTSSKASNFLWKSRQADDFLLFFCEGRYPTFWDLSIEMRGRIWTSPVWEWFRRLWRVEFVESGALTLNLSSTIEPLASYLASLNLSSDVESKRVIVHTFFGSVRRLEWLVITIITLD